MQFDSYYFKKQLIKMTKIQRAKGNRFDAANWANKNKPNPTL